MALTDKHFPASPISITFTCAAIAGGLGLNSPGRKGRSALRRNTSRCLKNERNKVSGERIFPTRYPEGGTYRVPGPSLERRRQAANQKIHFLPDMALDQWSLERAWTSFHFMAPLVGRGCRPAVLGHQRFCRTASVPGHLGRPGI